MATMATKTVIITGANTGLGFECAKEIASTAQDWHIVLACRDIAKGEQAAQSITNATTHSAISVLPLDLASLASVHRFVELFSQQTLPPLQGLVCNAGVQVSQGVQETADGFELTFGVNHLGHFLLTNLLLKYLVEPTRIIVVSSGTHNPRVPEGRSYPATYMNAERLADTAQSQILSGMQRYTTSKLCNLLFAYELDRRLQAAQRAITVNSFDPGGVPETSLLRGELSMSLSLMRTALRKEWVRRILGWANILISTPERSGQAMARLLLDPTLAKNTGKYFQLLTERRSSDDSYNQSYAKELWDDTARLVGLEKRVEP